MQSQQVNQQPNNLPLVVGGNNTRKLQSWLREIGIPDYRHLSLTIESIDPALIEVSARQIQDLLDSAHFLYSVGAFGDRVLTVAGRTHGAFPNTKTKDFKLVQKCVKQCRDYTLGRMHVKSDGTNFNGPEPGTVS